MPKSSAKPTDLKSNPYPRVRHRGNTLVGPSSVEDDSSEDDMFSSSFDPASKETISQIRKSADHTGKHLSENFDDADGYYRVVVGDMILGRYKIVSKLGSGVFATVVQAEDIVSQTKIALKILRNNDVMLKSGLKELELLKKVESPDQNGTIIRCISSFDFRGHLCLAFELMSMNMRDFMSKHRGMSIREIQPIAAQLFEALSVLRKSQILHADIKPDNILLNQSAREIKLADFGSASDMTENEPTPYLVSRYYRAPEITLGIPYDYGIDLWSVACTLFELFDGNFLFPGKSGNHMLKLMMELKGRFPVRILRKARFAEDHFDMSGSGSSYLFIDRTIEAPGMSARKLEPAIAPKVDLRKRLSAPSKVTEVDLLIEQFVLLLDKCLNLNPEKRMNCFEASLHPFCKYQ